MDRSRLAVVGVGHLGKEHARILAGMPDVELVAVVDARPEQAEAVALRCGSRGCTDYRELLDQVDAAVIAVPTVQHHAVACDFLRAGVPLLIEKPLAATLPEADELVYLARKHEALLQVGHIERFNPAFERLRQFPMRPKMIHARRLSSFSGRSLDIGVVLDLMIHDIDLVLNLVPAPVREVEAVGVSVLGGHEDLSQASLRFANGCVAHLSASRVNPAAVRRLDVWSSEGHAGADLHRQRLRLVQPSERLRRLRKAGPDPDPATLAALRTELFTEFLPGTELDCACDGPDQLTRELTEFVASVRTGTPVRVTGEQGREALAVACMILDGIRRHAWEGEVVGPIGPRDVPPPAGRLFDADDRSAAA